MSVSKCIQHLPGTLRRWWSVVLLASLLGLALLAYLQTPPGVVRPALRPAGLQRVPRAAGPSPQPQTVEEWNQRAAAARASRAGPPREYELDGAGAARPEPVAPVQRELSVPRRRVVHLDLKGAPPTVDYLTSLLPLVRRLGATGLLIEWEDMFPFSGELRPAAARNHYSRAEVRRLLAEARRLGLQVIPLVQTFGHLEPFLKLEPFARLREEPAQPAALCPSRNASFRLVQMIVDQVMEMHRGAEFVHIGCDEVYHMGLCERCRERMRDELYLEHVVRVARYVRARHRATPIIWDDMMRHIPADVLRRSGIGQLVEPMVWVYAEDVYRFVGPHVYHEFAQVFPRVWGASAYKGAFGETLTAPPIGRHLDNTLNWLTVMRQEGPAFSEGFRGLVLTGWQRYDHMAVLCELLPAAVPSLAVTLAAASSGFFNSSLRGPLYEALACPSASPYEPFVNLNSDPHGFYVFSACGFPGHQFFNFVGQLMSIVSQAEEFLTTATQKKGWLTAYNVEHNYTNPFRVDEVMEMYYTSQFSLVSAVGSAKESLKGVMDRFTVAEWVEQRILPWLRRFEELRRQGEALKRRSVWPRRPLPMLAELARYGLNVSEPERSRVGGGRRGRRAPPARDPADSDPPHK